MNIPEIIKENLLRRDKLFAHYDPVLGIGSPIPRKKISYFAEGLNYSVNFPEEMVNELPVLNALQEIGSIEELLKVNKQAIDVNVFLQGLMAQRLRYDFEFWCISTVKIQDKDSKVPIPFKINIAQRKLLQALEELRLAGVPIRIILLKARQWGGSTLVQVYMAWIQTLLKRNWHSAIIADVEDQVRNIRSMYTKLAKEYPESIGTITFAPFEGSTKNKVIVERDCIVGIGSAQKPDSFRSYDFAMAHMSEVAFWKSTKSKSADDLIQAFRALLPDEPLTLEILESTAKGVGNLFHKEWLAAEKKISGYRAVFVAWHEAERYVNKIDSYTEFIKHYWQNEYAKFLWDCGATLEGIKWYFDFKRKKNYDDWRMMSEFPSNANEAFQSTGRRVYPQKSVKLVRKNCMAPSFIGGIVANDVKGKNALEGIRFEENPKGEMYIWTMPDYSINVSNRYAIIVDIGGASEGADWSVIKVFDRYWMLEGGVPEVVATWRGHIDQDLLAWLAAQIAKMYCNGLLVMESNSLRTEEADTEGDHFFTILDEIVDFYENIYTRTAPEKIKEGKPINYGFHMNILTKPMIINAHKAAARDEAYVERDHRACDEMDTYEIKENGSYGAVKGEHDDINMTSAIGVWICLSYMDMPVIIVISDKDIGVRKIASEASF